jgi:hypothetical protein
MKRNLRDVEVKERWRKSEENMIVAGRFYKAMISAESAWTALLRRKHAGGLEYLNTFLTSPSPISPLRLSSHLLLL